LSSLINISERASLAIHSMVLVARSRNGRATIKELAEHLDASANHLAKVFQNLGKAGLVRSVRGPAGGYQLNQPAEEIACLDIFEAVEGPVKLTGCPLGKDKCYFDKCIFSAEMRRITRDLYASLKSMNLSDFVAERLAAEKTG